MKKFLKKIIVSIFFYVGVIVTYILPVFLIFLFFDLVYDFKIDFFEEGSPFFRIILAIWTLFVHGVWLYVEFGEKIKKYI